MDSVTAQIIQEGFEAMENCLLTLLEESRQPKGASTYGPARAKTNAAFESMRAYMHDGPEVEDNDGTV